MPKRISYRRKAHHRNDYTIGSPEFIKELYDRYIRDAEKEGNHEEVKSLTACKKIALKRAEERKSNKHIEGLEMEKMN